MTRSHVTAYLTSMHRKAPAEGKGCLGVWCGLQRGASDGRGPWCRSRRRWTVACGHATAISLAVHCSKGHNRRRPTARQPPLIPEKPRTHKPRRCPIGTTRGYGQAPDGGRGAWPTRLLPWTCVPLSTGHARTKRRRRCLGNTLGFGAGDRYKRSIDLCHLMGMTSTFLGFFKSLSGCRHRIA